MSKVAARVATVKASSNSSGATDPAATTSKVATSVVADVIPAAIHRVRMEVKLPVGNKEATAKAAPRDPEAEEAEVDPPGDTSVATSGVAVAVDQVDVPAARMARFVKTLLSFIF